MSGTFSQNGTFNTMANLETFDISGNDFRGMRLGSKVIKSINVSGNKNLSSISFYTATPEAISTLEFLTTFNFSNAKLGGGMGGTENWAGYPGMPNLEYLNIDSNLKIRTFNVGVSNATTKRTFRNLKVLILSNNQLTSIPDSLLTSSKLTHLAFENNNIKTFQSKIDEMSNLTHLSVEDNDALLSALPKRDNTGGLTYTYAPQRTTIFPNKSFMDTINLTTEAQINVEGSIANTSFKWYIVNSDTSEAPASASEVIPVNGNHGKFTFSNTLEGKKLRCKMTNSNFPNLAQNPITIEFNIQGYDKDEVAEIKRFLAQASGIGDSTNAQMLGITDIEKWLPGVNQAGSTGDGIFWTGSGAIRNVSTFAWGGRRVGGSIDLTKFTKIENINIADGQMTSVVFNPEMKTLNSVRLGGNLLNTLVLPQKSSAYELVEIYNNKFKLSDIAPLLDVKIKTFRYAPQQIMNGDTINFEDQIDLSSQANIREYATKYRWYDITNGKTPQNSGIALVSDGVYEFSRNMSGKKLRCEMSNDSIPFMKGDSIFAYEVVIKSIIPYATQEVEAFKAFFRQTAGGVPGEQGKTNGEVLRITDIENWNPEESFGNIYWNNEPTRRCTEIRWLGMNVGGRLDLTSMDKLEYIDVDKNPITYIAFPDSTPNLKVILGFQTSLDTVIMPKSAPLLFSIQFWMSDLNNLIIPSDASNLVEVLCYGSKIKNAIFPRIPMNKLHNVTFYRNELETLVLPSEAPRLRYLKVYENKLKEIQMPDVYMDSLQYFNIENNLMTFETLPRYTYDLMHYSGRAGVYSAMPQDTMREENVNPSTEIDLSGEYSVEIDGVEKITTFDWYFLDKNILRALPLSAAMIDKGEGKFEVNPKLSGRTLYCIMKNANYPEHESHHDGAVTRKYNENMIFKAKITGDTVSIVVSGNSFEENALDNNVVIYPNPAKSFVNIVTTTPILKVEFYNIAGALLDTQKSESGQYNVSNLQAGTHIVKIYTNKGKIISKRITIVQ